MMVQPGATQAQVFLSATGGATVIMQSQQAPPITAPKSRWNPLARVLFWASLPALFLALCLGAPASSNGPWMFSFKNSQGSSWNDNTNYAADKDSFYSCSSTSLTFCAPFFAGDTQVPFTSLNSTASIVSSTKSFRSGALAVTLFPIAAGALFLISGLCCQGSRQGNCGCCGDSCASSPQSACADSQMLRATFIVGVSAAIIGIADIIATTMYKTAVTNWFNSSAKAFVPGANTLNFESGTGTATAGAAFLLIVGGLLLTAFTIVMCNPKKGSMDGPSSSSAQGYQTAQPAMMFAQPQQQMMMQQPQMQMQQPQYYTHPQQPMQQQQPMGYPPMQNPYPPQQPGYASAPAQSPYPQGLAIPTLQGQPQQPPQAPYAYPSPQQSQAGGYYPQPQPMAMPQQPAAYPYPQPSAPGKTL